MIQLLHIENFLALSVFDLRPTNPVVIIAGPNWSGKTSIQQAIRLALAGEIARVKLKGEYGELVRDGAEKALIRVAGEFSGETIISAKGKSTGIPNADDVPTALAYLLDQHRLASVGAADRRRLLFDLAKINVSAEAVAAKAREFGGDADRLRAVLHMLPSGFDAVASECKIKAAEARATWKAITGQAYGKEKALSWAPTVREIAADDYAAAQEAERIALAEARTLDGEAKRLERAHADNRALVGKLDRARELAKLLGRREEALRSAEKELSGLLPQLEHASAELAATSGALPATVREFVCPECATDLVEIDNKLRKREDYRQDLLTQDRAELRARSNRLEAAVSLMRRTVENRKRDVAEANDAALSIAALEASIASVTETAVRSARQEAERAWQKHEAALAALRDLDVAAKAAERAGQQRIDALAAHEDCVAWVRLEELMSPSGVPATLLESGLAPINERLRDYAQATGWKQAMVLADMSIRIDGRKYGLCSEAERWLADAMLLAAISDLSGIQLLMLDRIDVLSPDHRATLVRWCLGLGERGKQTWLFGTLKNPPAVAGAHCIWLGADQGAV